MIKSRPCQCWQQSWLRFFFRLEKEGSLKKKKIWMDLSRNGKHCWSRHKLWPNGFSNKVYLIRRYRKCSWSRVLRVVVVSNRLSWEVHRNHALKTFHSLCRMTQLKNLGMYDHKTTMPRPQNSASKSKKQNSWLWKKISSATWTHSETNQEMSWEN